MQILADPWDPAFGMGFSIDEDDPATPVDLAIEGVSWASPIPGSPPEPLRVGFVDGVRRIEMRLLVVEDGTRAAGALGSFAVGCAYAGSSAGFGNARVVRRFISGAGLKAPALEVRIGKAIVRWEPVSTLGEDDMAAQFALHNEMRVAEADVARQASAGGCELVLVDGPLGFHDPTESPVIGVVKRSMRRYLDGDPAALLPRLKVGERTPLFVIGESGSGTQRFSWYTRIAELQPAWHDHAGLVRCEASISVGLDAARQLADQVTGLLPTYAGSPADRRTPQNLGPVASLERKLKHAMGDEALLRRAALAQIIKRERSAS